MNLVADIEKAVEPLLAQGGVELVHVEYRREQSGWVLRFYLDKEGGFTLADCQEWSNRLEEELDKGDLLQGPYALEVSSPGLNRPLRARKDFERFLGIEAVIKLHAPQNNQRNFHGRMVSLEGEGLTLLDRTSGLVKIPLSSIASARLDPTSDLPKS